ncbi:MAG: hypothetical protein HQ579_09410 [Candidatus Omnitrophica bacterium]|nr:hypothetical protein [Candidatus Omnitrophota bacterium]
MVGFIVAAVSYFVKPVGMIIAALSLIPFALALISGQIQVLIDPSNVQPATDGIMTSFVNYLTGSLLDYPGAALFGAMVGIFAPGGNAA